MIASIIFIITAFYWLMLESDWLSIKLPIGVIGLPIIPCTTEEIRQLRYRFFNNGFHRTMKYWGSYIANSISEPICGWEYLRDYGNLQVECTIEVTAHGIKNTASFINPSSMFIKQVARSMLH